MTTFEFCSNSEADTDRLGNLLAQVLPPGSVVALIGTLGAGKTRLVQAVARALGVPNASVTSPTFVLMNDYPGGRLPIYHFDTYRLVDEDEFLELGPEEYFDGEGITFVEWADRVADLLPDNVVEVQLEVTGPTNRLVKISATSESMLPVVEKLCRTN